MSSRMSLKSPICRVLAARSRCVVEAKILIKIYKYGEQNYAVFKVESERALPLLPVLLLSAYCRCCCRSVCLCWRWRRRCRFLLILLIVLLLLPLRDDEPSNTTANRMDGRGRLAREREREHRQRRSVFGQQQMLGERQHSHSRGITKHSLAREHRTINENAKETHTQTHREQQKETVGQLANRTGQEGSLWLAPAGLPGAAVCPTCLPLACRRRRRQPNTQKATHKHTTLAAGSAPRAAHSSLPLSLLAHNALPFLAVSSRESLARVA